MSFQDKLSKAAERVLSAPRWPNILKNNTNIVVGDWSGENDFISTNWLGAVYANPDIASGTKHGFSQPQTEAFEKRLENEAGYTALRPGDEAFPEFFKTYIEQTRAQLGLSHKWEIQRLKLLADQPQKWRFWIRYEETRTIDKQAAELFLSEQNDFQNHVRKAYADTTEARRKRLQKATGKAQRVLRVVEVFCRNPDVIAERLYLANGKCVSCRKPAPFLRASDGSPFLEVHHIKPLASGGPDTVENTQALCPNCHREKHYG